MASPGAVVIYIPGCLLPGFRPPVLIVYRVGFAESCSTLIGQPFYKARSILGRVASVAGALAAATLALPGSYKSITFGLSLEYVQFQAWLWKGKVRKDKAKLGKGSKGLCTKRTYASYRPLPPSFWPNERLFWNTVCKEAILNSGLVTKTIWTLKIQHINLMNAVLIRDILNQGSMYQKDLCDYTPPSFKRWAYNHNKMLFWYTGCRRQGLPVLTRAIQHQGSMYQKQPHELHAPSFERLIIKISI